MSTIIYHNLNHTLYRFFIFVAIFVYILLFSLDNKANAYGDQKTKEAIEAAFNAKDYETLYKLVESHAKSGEKKAQFHSCILNWHGMGVPSSAQMAVIWCKKASEEQSEASKYIEFIENSQKKNWF